MQCQAINAVHPCMKHSFTHSLTHSLLLSTRDHLSSLMTEHSILYTPHSLLPTPYSTLHIHTLLSTSLPADSRSLYESNPLGSLAPLNVET